MPPHTPTSSSTKEPIKQSLTTQAAKRINHLAAQYTIGGNVSGTLLLKVCTLEARNDTNYTVNHLRTKLANLPQLMQSVNSDVKTFNSQVPGR